jgi:hypothetical protein
MKNSSEEKMMFEPFDHDAAAGQGVSGDKSYLTLPKIAAESVRMLWDEDYYDGPLSGKCLVDSKMYHFRCVDEGVTHWDVENDDKDLSRSDPWRRRYELIELSVEEEAEALRRQDLVLRHVGGWHDHREGPRKWQPTGSHHLFYDEAKNWPPLPPAWALAVAWFEI